jgi:phosphoglycerate dehydrogenase-like enzyme
MSRDICIFQDFLTDAYKARITAAAEAAGMVPHYFTTDQFEEARACVQHCEVLYAQSPELLRAAPATLRWYCVSSAGVDIYCKNDGIFANPDCLLTNSNSYGVTISEYVVMVTLLLLRRIPEYIEPLRNHQWAPPRPIRSIRDSEITILGTGNIGCNVAERMRGMGAARIVGISRSGKAREAVYDEMHPISELDSVLPRVKILVMALPSTAETAGILSRERIALLPEDAIIINVGRGTALDQTALVEALNSGSIAGAALDVMVPEPLPADDPLWDAKNLVLTPHTSGNLTLGHTCDVNVDMFCEDIANYAAGRPLAHLVDRTRGY